MRFIYTFVDSIELLDLIVPQSVLNCLADASMQHFRIRSKCNVRSKDDLTNCVNRYSITPAHFAECSDPALGFPTGINFDACIADQFCEDYCVRAYLFKHIFLGQCSEEVVFERQRNPNFSPVDLTAFVQPDDWALAWFLQPDLCVRGSLGSVSDVCAGIYARVWNLECSSGFPLTDDLSVRYRLPTACLPFPIP